MATYLLVLILLAYTTIPPVYLFYSLKLVYKDKDKYGIHLHYLGKFLITLSFLPMLAQPAIDLGLTPKSEWSLAFLFLTFGLALLGVKRATKREVVFFYFSGIFAAFMEEILYRGVIFGLCLAIWGNQWIALFVSSLGFGIWHLKNYHWTGKMIIIQFLYTALVYGPIFAIMRITTGDIYLAILYHFLTDATVALAPDWTRGWLVYGGKGLNYLDRSVELPAGQ